MHRPILCNFNTLFVLEINDSFSDNKRSSEKFKNYQEEIKEDVNKKETRKYLNSYIVFFYNKKIKIIFYLK